MGSWGPIGATAGTLLGSAAGAIVNATMSPAAVMAYGWRIPFIIGLGVGLGGLVIRRHFVERVPHQAPAKSPLREAFRSHWRTMLHLVALIAGICVGFYTAEPRFLSSRSLVSITQFAAPVGIIALGIVLVLLLGEIDLSVGSVSGFASAVMAVTLLDQGQSTVVAMLAGILVGVAIGALYAVLYTKLGVPSFVFSLAGLLGFQGALLYVLGENGTRNRPLPKPGRLTRSPGDVISTCSISSRMCASSSVAAVRPRRSMRHG